MNADEQKVEDRRAVKMLDDRGEGLSAWEIDFVESCVRTLNADRVLSSRQRAKVRDIIGERVQ